MASSSSLLLFMISLLTVLPILSSARPCKTLFFAYTISSSENLHIAATSGDVDPAPSRYFAVYRVISPSFPLRHRQDPTMVGPAEEDEEEWFMGMSSSSLQERARDILVVVAGLLFGVGCGAITAATMYLAWSLITNRYHACGSHDDDEDEDEYAGSPEKMTGYVRIVYDEPEAPKEGYEG